MPFSEYLQVPSITKDGLIPQEQPEEHDDEGSSQYSSGLFSTNLCTPMWIPPEQIEVKMDGGWTPIQQISSVEIETNS